MRVCVYTYTCACVCIYIYTHIHTLGSSEGKEPAHNAGDWGSVPVSGRSLGEGHNNPHQYSSWRIPWTGRLVGYSPWNHKELDMTKQLTHTHILSL